MTRKRRGNLRGWTKALPFVLIPFSLLFLEVWFQTQILNHEYDKNALRSNIQEAETRLEELHDEIRELARMERVLEHAPDLGLIPPAPGQVVEVQLAGRSSLDTVDRVSVVPVLAAPPPRTAPLAAVKKEPTKPEPLPLLEKLELLEPEVEWIE